MAISNNTPALTFTDAERRKIDGARNDLALHLGRKVTLETCAEDGDEWALIALADHSPEGPEPLVSVQLTRGGGRSFALIMPNGRIAPRTEPSEDLGALLPQLHRAALVWFRSIVPNTRAAMVAAVVPMKDLAESLTSLEDVPTEGEPVRKPRPKKARNRS